MKIHYILIISVFLLNILFLSPCVAAEDNINVDIQLKGENNRIINNKKAMVAGIWNYVNITTSKNYDELSLIFYKSISTPSEKNVSNYYTWGYSKTDVTTWQDLIKYDDFEYIQRDFCSAVNNVYSFYVGIGDTLPNILDYREDWTLEVYSEDDLLYSEVFYIEKPTVGVGLSGDSVDFGMDPFTEREYITERAFSMLNTGNLPLLIDVDYGENYEKYVDVSNNNIIISPSEKSTHDVTINSDSWKPGMLSISGGGGGKVPDEFIIVTNAMINFNSFYDPGIPTINLFIGHGTHDIIEIPNTGLVFQYYKQMLTLKEDETYDLKIYVSGEGKVKSLDIWMDDRNSGEKKVDESNITIQKITDDDGKEIIPPLRNIISLDTKEYVVTINLKAIRAGTDSFIRYKLKYEEDDGEIKELIYSTKIAVEGLSSDDDSNSDENEDIDSNMSIFVGLIVVFSFGYIVISHIRRRRR